MIDVDHLSKAFHTTAQARSVPALRDISFRVEAGEVLGVIGKSGAGKTTLLRVLSLQIPADRGTIKFGAVSIDQRTPAAVRRDVLRRTSTVFQGFSLLYNRSVLDNVALPLKLRRVAAAQRIEKAREMLDFVGLAALREAYPITLSGGEAQRVAIARALITEPSVLFLDEPTSALDAETSRDILDLLRRVQRTYPVAMIFVAHHMGVVRYMCDRVLHLEDGAIKRQGAIQRSSTFQIDQIDHLWEEPADA